MTGGSPQGKHTQSTNRSKREPYHERDNSLEKQKKKVHLKQLKEIITVLLVMTHFLDEERGKEVMTVFRGSFEK